MEVGTGLTAKLLEVENGQGYKVKIPRTTQTVHRQDRLSQILNIYVTKK